MFEELKREVASIGKPEWRGLLRYAAELHERSTHPARPPFQYPWEEIGPGYHYGPAFGHWDIVHSSIDSLPSEPDHVRFQLLNYLGLQDDKGFIPGMVHMQDPEPRISMHMTHPPVWPVLLQEYFDLTGDRELLQQGLAAAQKQITWFEAHRRAGSGYYYLDIVERKWESGIDEGIRFDDVSPEALPCIDATCHVFGLYFHETIWSGLLGANSQYTEERTAGIRSFIQNEMFDDETGFFHDPWAVENRNDRRLAFEGIWPLVMGIATPEQAERVVRENLLSEDRFFSHHPLSSVALADPAFELRCWRGPAWNSMTFWAARGCSRYGMTEAARILLERALDETSVQYSKTGKIWEFYHPLGGSPLDLQRKPRRQENFPSPDYLGHNPLIAMARLWEKERI